MFRKLSSSSRLTSISYLISKRMMSACESREAKEDVARVIRAASVFCFDVDSTVITKEGIDELAAFKNVGKEVAELTSQAMGGTVLFQDALAARLNIIKPSRQDISNFLTQHPLELTPGVEELISTLHSQGKMVYLVSGGFRQMIEPVADRLQIPYHRIFANTLLFNDNNGEFAGFDPKEPTSRDGGKPAVIQSLIDAHGYNPIVMVGDGATDLQARPPANLFIGFGGIVVREKVQAEADWFIYNFEELQKIIEDPTY